MTDLAINAENVSKRFWLHRERRTALKERVVRGRAPKAQEFWASVGASTTAEIIVSGSLEFKVEDRSGYKSEEYVSPIDGRTYYRQVYVEQTGFMFDIVFLVFDGRTGEKLLQDEFKDFRQASKRSVDELQGLFENLFSLENQILNTFVARDREAERYIFTD